MIPGDIDTSIARVAALLDGSVTVPGSWFDGFWDFFVRNKERIHAGPAWEIQAGWGAVLMMAPPSCEGAFEVHVFVECTDRRPGIRAPWPVSFVVLGSDAPAAEGAPDRHDRPHDEGIATLLAEIGFVPYVGYWGIRATRVVLDDASVEGVRDLLEDLPAAVRLACELGERLPEELG